MNKDLLEVLLAGALLALFGPVATFAVAVFWAAASARVPGSGLSAALYAPFALLAVALPVLSAPLAKRALSGEASAWPMALRFAALIAIAEALILSVRLAAGEPALAALPTHALLVAYSATTAILLGRNSHDTQPPRTSA